MSFPGRIKYSRAVNHPSRELRRKEAGFAAALALITATVLVLVSLPISTSSVDSTSHVPDCNGGALQSPYVAQNWAIFPGRQLVLCVEFYYYSGSGSKSGPTTMNPSDQLDILTLHGEDASSNFTITYSTAQVTDGGKNLTVQIGGPSSENEGYLVEYRIAPKTTEGVSNGTYILNFKAWLPLDALRNPPGGTSKVYGTGPIGGEQCGQEFEFAVGGSPDYRLATHCVEVVGGDNQVGVAGSRYVPDVLIAAVIGVSTAVQG